MFILDDDDIISAVEEMEADDYITEGNTDTVDLIAHYLYTFNLSKLTVNIVVYISGWTSRKLRKTVKCTDCLVYLEDPDIDKSVTHLLRIKNKGGLVIPSRDVISVCLECEKLFREKNYNEKNITNAYQLDNPYRTLSKANCQSVMYDVLVSCQRANLLKDIKYIS